MADKSENTAGVGELSAECARYDSRDACYTLAKNRCCSGRAASTSHINYYFDYNVLYIQPERRRGIRLCDNPRQQPQPEPNNTNVIHNEVAEQEKATLLTAITAV